MSERLLGIHPLVAAAGLVGLVAAVTLYAVGLGASLPAHPLTKSEAVARARAFAGSHGLDSSGMLAVAQTKSPGTERWDALASRFGPERLREAARSGELPLPAWTVRFRGDVTQEPKFDARSLELTLGGSGNVVGASLPEPDRGPAPPRDEARRIAVERLAALDIDLAGYAEPSETEKPDRDEDGDDEEGPRFTTSGPAGAPPPTAQEKAAEEKAAASSHRFVWEGADARWPGLTMRVEATVTAAGLTAFSHDARLDSDSLRAGTVARIVEITLYGFLCTFLVLILLGVLMFRLFSRDYVSISRAFVVASLFAAAVAINAIVVTDYSDSYLEIAFVRLLVSLLVGALVFVAWLAGEADAYYAWGRRATAAAIALASMRARARQVARETLEGYLWGWLLLGALAVAAAAVAAAAGPGAVKRDPYLYALDAHPTPLFAAALLPYTLFFAVVCLLFLPSWLHRITRRIWVAVPLASVCAGLFAATLEIADVRFGALPGSLSWSVAFSAIVVTIAARRGWLTGFFATFAFSAFFYGLAPMVAAGPGDRALAAAGAALAAVPAFAAFAVGHRMPSVEVREAPPPRMSRLMEQARRAEELDIARRVQSGLLPGADPAVEGFEIAGTCQPAQEVGGDYYDYFRLADGRFGVAVGDVSGKGVPAAFSMTLTKGFMEVAATEAREPDLVLGLANGHLRDILSRGTFVTMAYAVLDPESRTVTCARAGHNPPAILREGAAPEFVDSPGTALGAAPAARFESLIGARRVEMRRGDTLVFYTDGVTEAMSAAREQFGEERLLAALSRLRNSHTARGVVDELLGELGRHAHGADQHDDITIVVIRAA